MGGRGRGERGRGEGDGREVREKGKGRRQVGVSKRREGKVAREGGVRKKKREKKNIDKGSKVHMYVCTVRTVCMYVCSVAREYVWHIQYVSVHLVVRMCSTQKHSTCMYVTFISFLQCYAKF